MLTVQLILEVTVNVFGASVAVKLNAFGDTSRVGLTPDCATLTVRGCKPGLLTDTEAVRCSVPVLAVAVTESVPLLAPDDGEIASQSAFLLTVQLVLEATVSCFGVSEAAKLSDGGVTSSRGAALIDTGTVRGVRMPKPLTVIVAERSADSVFAAARIVTVAFLAPFDGVTVIHAASLDTSQSIVFELTVNDCSPPSNEK